MLTKDFDCLENILESINKIELYSAEKKPYKLYGNN